MAKNKILQSVSITFGQIAIGFTNKISFGLMWADLVGRFVASASLFRLFYITSGLKVNWHKKIHLLKQYKKFPLHEVPASLFNISALQAPLILIPLYFSPAVVGAYFLLFRVIMAPIALVGESIQQVFQVKASRSYHKTGNCRSIFLKTMGLLAIIGIGPTIILILWGEEIFIFVFGAVWEEAGVYAEILAPMAMIRLISAPLGYMFILREKLLWDMALQALFLVMTVLSIWVGGVNNDIGEVILYISYSGLLFYFLQISISFYLTKNGQYSRPLNEK
jgi:O-antigen/teichoic acid export membrane protein